MRDRENKQRPRHYRPVLGQTHLNLLMSMGIFEFIEGGGIFVSCPSTEAEKERMAFYDVSEILKIGCTREIGLIPDDPRHKMQFREHVKKFIPLGEYYSLRNTASQRIKEVHQTEAEILQILDRPLTEENERFQHTADTLAQLISKQTDEWVRLVSHWKDYYEEKRRNYGQAPPLSGSHRNVGSDERNPRPIHITPGVDLRSRAEPSRKVPRPRNIQRYYTSQTGGQRDRPP